MSCYISNLVSVCEYDCSSLFWVLARMATILGYDFYDWLKVGNGISSVVSSNKMYPFLYFMVSIVYYEFVCFIVLCFVWTRRPLWRQTNYFHVLTGKVFLEWIMWGQYTWTWIATKGLLLWSAEGRTWERTLGRTWESTEMLFL